MIYSRLDEPFVDISLSVRRTVAGVWLMCAWLAVSGGVVDGQMLCSVGIERRLMLMLDGGKLV